MPAPDAVIADIDYQEQQARTLTAQQAETARIFTICNASLRCGIDCPIWNHTPDDCKICGNADCVKAHQELERLWQEKP